MVSEGVLSFSSVIESFLLSRLALITSLYILSLNYCG